MATTLGAKSASEHKKRIGVIRSQVCQMLQSELAEIDELVKQIIK